MLVNFVHDELVLEVPEGRVEEVREIVERTMIQAADRFLLPFGAEVRQAVALCCLAPIAVFSTMFTDKVLGNARLAGFSLVLTAVVSLTLMTVARMALLG